jgi:hypothetical protein
MTQEPQHSAQQKIRTVLEDHLEHSMKFLILMETGRATTQERVNGHEIDTTQASIADAQLRIAQLKEALSDWDRWLWSRVLEKE